MPNLTRLLVILPKTFTTSCIVSKLSKLRVENVTVRDGTRIFQDSDITGLPWILPMDKSENRLPWIYSDYNEPSANLKDYFQVFELRKQGMSWVFVFQSMTA